MGIEGERNAEHGGSAMMRTMRVFVTGATGQLGRALAATRPADVDFVGLSSADLDITDPVAVAGLDWAGGHLDATDIVVNCAAYTRVDDAQAADFLPITGAPPLPGHVDGAMVAANPLVVNVNTVPTDEGRQLVAAFYYPEALFATDDIDDLASEYDEETDTFYWPAGWYELVNNWDDYASIAVHEGEVTHWHAMPECPTEVVR